MNTEKQDRMALRGVSPDRNRNGESADGLQRLLVVMDPEYDRPGYWDRLRAGTLDFGAWHEIEDGIARAPGHCMTMGTASTMTSVTETLGMTLPGAASIPAADSNHSRMAMMSGRRIVDMVWRDVRPADILTPAAFENAIVTATALGGSTNALVHMVAMAGRAGHEITLERFDEIAAMTPTLANIRPSGKYLMEDFYYAGGLRGLMGRLRDRLEL